MNLSKSACRQGTATEAVGSRGGSHVIKQRKGRADGEWSNQSLLLGEMAEVNQDESST
jgi:hypothetical protein